LSKKWRAAASAVFLGVVAWRADWTQIRAAFATLRLDLWFLAAGVYAVTQAVSALRWQMLSRPLGFREPFSRYLSYYYIGMFFNLILPTSVGGDVVRAWYLDGKSGRKADAFISVIADRVSGVFVLLLIALIALNLRPADLPAWVALTVTGMTGGALLVLGALFLVSRRLQRSAPTAQDSSAQSWRTRFIKLTKAFGMLPAAILPDRRTFFLTTLLSVVVQIANVMIVWLIGLALHVPVPGTYYFILVPTVTLLTLLPISLNGMGVREGAMALLLAPLGIEAASAVTLAFLWFMAFVLPSLGGVFFYLGTGGSRFRSGESGIGNRKSEIADRELPKDSSDSPFPIHDSRLPVGG
jgi:uncharacterized protein (TIRG00374 family)